MKQTTARSLKQAILLILVFFLSMGLFLASYHFDNKYKLRTPQAIGGTLFLDSTATPLTYLINGWQYYEGQLLAPEDFDKEPPVPDGYISIGQYPGMETGQADASPHGSTTYRLVLSLGDTPAFYTLELPEIYSAYRLYIDGRLTASCGTPDAADYKASIHSGSITFEASGDTVLLLAVSDWSYLYSGLVYPPAFGTSEQVGTLLDQQFAWSLSVTVLAFLLGLSQIILAAVTRDRKLLYSSVICIAFSISVCSLALHRLTATGIMPFYNIELFSRYAVYGAAVLLVNHLFGKINKVRALISIIALLFPAAAFFVPFIAPMLSYQKMLIFSCASGIYKIICALWILYTAFIIGIKSEVHTNSLVLLSGSCAFASSLVADRLYPSFEPIRFGWFSESAGLIFVLFLSFLMFKNALMFYRERIVLYQQNWQMEGQIQLQKKHYTELVSQMETIRTMRHDIRHYFTQLSLLLKENRIEEASNYLNTISGNTPDSVPLTFCDNYMADVLLRYYYSRASESGISVSICAKLPSHTGIQDADLSVILGNILENAVEACLRLPKSKRFLTLNVTRHSSNLYIEVSNAFTGDLSVRNGIYDSRKKPGRAGIGLSSIRTIAEKYDGEVWVNTESTDTGYVFTIYVLLLVP